MRRTRVVVIGSGPSGICAVAGLVSKGTNVTWIDSNHHRVGRLSKFNNVHSNTKVKLLENWFNGPLLSPLIASSARAQAATKALRDGALPLKYALGGKAQYSPEERWCKLGAVVRVFEAIAETLHAHPLVTTLSQTVTELRRMEEKDHWTVLAQGDVDRQEVKASAVILAVGAEPNTIPVIAQLITEGNTAGNGPRVLSAELAIDRDQLEANVKAGEKVALIGHSHSGSLIAMHMRDLGYDRDLTVFARRPVRNAIWEQPPGQYLYSATGLKGAAAAFVESQQQERVRAPSSASTPVLSHTHAADVSAETLGAFDVVIAACGYSISKLPAIYFGKSGNLVDIGARDPKTSQLAIPGCKNSLLMGTGIGWNEYFAEPPQPGKSSPPGFGEPVDQREGLLGEKYVGFNAMIMRATHIAESQLWIQRRPRL